MTDKQNKSDIKISDRFKITETDSLRQTSQTYEIEITKIYFNEYWRAKFKGKQSGHIGEIPVDILSGTDTTLDDARGPRWTFEVSKIA